MPPFRKTEGVISPEFDDMISGDSALLFQIFPQIIVVVFVVASVPTSLQEIPFQTFRQNSGRLREG